VDDFPDVSVPLFVFPPDCVEGFDMVSGELRRELDPIVPLFPDVVPDSERRGVEMPEFFSTGFEPEPRLAEEVPW